MTVSSSSPKLASFCLDRRPASLLRDVRSFASNPPLRGQQHARSSDSSASSTRTSSFAKRSRHATGNVSSRISINLQHKPFGSATQIPNDRDRIDDLVQRTNQLNVSGRKYKREELQPILNDLSLEKYVLDCADEYGLREGGFRQADTTRAIDVRDFMLSCRVQGKFIEQAFFNYLCQTHPGSPLVSASRVDHVPTARNLPARKVLETLNFGESSDDGLTLDLTRHSLSCDFRRVESKSSL